jgi:hypothetical protein
MSLPATRNGETRKIKCGRYTLYCTLNSIDGKPVELFIKASRNGHPESVEGSLVAFLDPMAKLASRAMQAGVPWETILADWRGTRFEPSQLGKGTSPLDAIAREYLEEQPNAGNQILSEAK